jgi:type IV pilus biogenesis protein CpaD/CtpE
MQPKNKPFKPALMLMPLLLLTVGCANRSPIIVPATPIPLPAQAKVSLVPTPSVCSQSCLKGWQTEVQKSVDTLTK